MVFFEQKKCTLDVHVTHQAQPHSRSLVCFECERTYGRMDGRTELDTDITIKNNDHL